MREVFPMPEIVVHFRERLVGVHLADPNAELPQLAPDVATSPLDEPTTAVEPPPTDTRNDVADGPSLATAADSPADVPPSVSESGATT